MAPDPASGPLPSYEPPSADELDPDKTLRYRKPQGRKPQVNATEEIQVEDVLEVAELSAAPAQGAGSTQEIAVEDVLDVIPLRQRVYPNTRITVAPETEPSSPFPTSAPSFTPSFTPAPTAWITTPPRTYLPPPPPRPPSYANLAMGELAAPPSLSKLATIAPVAFDVVEPTGEGGVRPRAESAFSLEALRGSLFRRRRLDVGIAVAVGAFIGVFIVGFALRSVSAKPVPQVGALRATTTNATTSVAAGRAPIGIARSSNESTSATGAKTKASASTFTSSAPATPTFDVLSLPQAQVGTISVAHSAAGHRLFIDGSVYNNGTAMVSCGRHVVRVGSHGRAQAVDLNCGSDVVVAP